MPEIYVPSPKFSRLSALQSLTGLELNGRRERRGRAPRRSAESTT
jgi:hypothetical protein